jgi:hypothetical protein
MNRKMRSRLANKQAKVSKERRQRKDLIEHAPGCDGNCDPVTVVVIADEDLPLPTTHTVH